MCPRQSKRLVSRESRPTSQRNETLALKAKYLKLGVGLSTDFLISLVTLRTGTNSALILAIGSS